MNDKHRRILIHIILIIGSITMLFPFIWMILTSLKAYGEAIRVPLTIFPEVIKWENYTKATTALPFGYLYFNTIVLMIIRILCAVIFSSMAGYAFARIKFPGNKFLFSIVLIQMMLPAQIFIIPQYLMVAKLEWLNTIRALVFPGLVSAFGTFLLRQFFKSIPRELEEAAIIDGCNQWRIYWRIMMPLAKNSLVALSIFTAIFAWKELMWPLIANMSIDKMTLSAGLASLQGQHSTDYPVVMAGSFLALLPMLIVYIIFQRKFVQGITLTGTKG